MSTTTLHLAKQNFKFSAAHFLIFDEKSAERLHGHNYRVRVDIGAPAADDFSKDGYFIDFNVFKKFIKAELDKWDEMVLLPEKHPDMKFRKTDKSLEVTFRERFYVFPMNEVILLPVNNTSVEEFSRLLADKFYREFTQYKITKMSVYVEESPGQGAATSIPS